MTTVARYRWYCRILLYFQTAKTIPSRLALGWTVTIWKSNKIPTLARYREYCTILLHFQMQKSITKARWAHGLLQLNISVISPLNLGQPKMRSHPKVFFFPSNFHHTMGRLHFHRIFPFTGPSLPKKVQKQGNPFNTKLMFTCLKLSFPKVKQLLPLTFLHFSIHFRPPRVPISVLKK